MDPKRESQRFNLLVSELKSRSYKVYVTEEMRADLGGKTIVYRYAIVRGRNILAHFYEGNDHWGVSHYVDGKIAADHARCFDKLSKCPFVMRLPRTKKDAKKIAYWLRRLGTKKGFRISNTYAYLTNNPFPRKV